MTQQNRGMRRIPGKATIPAANGNIARVQPFGRKQALYNLKAALYAKYNVLTTPGYLRVELNLTGSQSTLPFQVLQGQNQSQNVTERRLKLNDSFTVADFAFYLGTYAMIGATPTNAELAAMRLRTFPNPYTAGPYAGTNDRHLAIYNGYMQLRIDQTVFIDSYPMEAFYRVGTAQQAYGVGGAGNNQIAMDEFGLGFYGKNEMLPTIELNGKANIDMNITLPVSTNVAAAAGFGNTAVFYLLGFLNQGGADVQKQVDQELEQMARKMGV
jgi:hypothetical protein